MLIAVIGPGQIFYSIYNVILFLQANSVRNWEAAEAAAAVERKRKRPSMINQKNRHKKNPMKCTFSSCFTVTLPVMSVLELFSNSLHFFYFCPFLLSYRVIVIAVVKRAFLSVWN